VKIILSSLDFTIFYFIDFEEFHSLGIFAAALTSLWLISPYIANRQFYITLSVAFLNFVVVVLIKFLDMKIFGEYDYEFLLFYVIGILCILMGLIVPGIICRKKFSKLRFLVWVFTLIGLVGIVTILIVEKVSYGYYYFAGAAGAIFSITTFFIVAPFIFLAFYGPVYRERFDKVFRLKRT